MAILIIVVLFGVLFLGAGGLLWVWIRAERAQRAAEVEARYQEQVAREHAEAATRMAEETRNTEQVQGERPKSVNAAADTAPVEGNEPRPSHDGKVQVP